MKLDKSPRPKRLADRASAAPSPPPLPQGLEQTRWQRRAQWLRNHPLVVIMETAGLIGLIFAVVFFFYELRERHDERVARAWQLVTTPASGNSGKVEALEYLNSRYGCNPISWPFPWAGRCWKERTSLHGVDFSQPKGRAGAYLRFVQLPHADLNMANFSGAILEGANLYQTHLVRAELTEANLAGSDLHGATLTESNLTRAVLDEADMSDAYMLAVDLTDAELNSVDFRKAYLVAAKLIRAGLSQANMRHANLECVDWSAPGWGEPDPDWGEFDGEYSCTNLSGAFLFDADLSNANLSGANLSGAVLSAANLSGTILIDANLTDVELNKSWIYEGAPPQGVLTLPVGGLATRKEEEPWAEFVDRIMRERPELGWTKDMNRIGGYWD
ncbi:MAG: pentapeptide repeat-containing protein [Roseibium sp.]